MISISTTSRQRGVNMALVGLLAVGLAGAPPTHADAVAADGGEALIRQTADELLAIVRNGELSPQTKRARIEDTLYSKADFNTVAKLVLARNWSRFDEAQRTRFIEQFRRYLSVTYGRNIDTYTDDPKSVEGARMEVLGSRDEARGDRTVHTQIIRKGEPNVVVDYRVRQRDGQWLIIDVVAEGISMISNLRSQFQEIISRGGPEHLLKKLAEKNAENE